MAKRKRKIYTKKTLLIVGEGPQEEAFIKHLKSLFIERKSNQTIKVQSADGGSPRSIIEYVVRKRHTQYDRRYILMDSDVVLSAADKAYATKNDINILQSKPICLDCMLLKILGEQVPNSNKKCKKQLHSLLNGPPTAAASYAKLFTQKLLADAKEKAITELIELIKNKKQ